MSVPVSSASSRPARLPWSAAAATVLSYLAMLLSARSLWLLPLLALAVLLSYLVDARLRGTRFGRLMLRAGLIAAIVFLNPEDPSSAYEQFGPARQRNIFALVCATEAALQYWRPRDEDRAWPLLTALTASGLTLISASNTFDDRFIRWIMPPFLLLAALAARDYRLRAPITHQIARQTGLFLRAAALLLTVGIGAGSNGAAVHYRGELTDWSNRFLFRDALNFEVSGMSQSPSLGPIFGLRGSAARVLRITHFTGDSHWRGMAFFVYRKGRWGPATEERTLRRGSGAEVLRPPQRAERKNDTVDLRVTRLVNDNPLVYAPLSTVTLDTGEAASVAWSSEFGGPLRTRARAPYEYTVALPVNSREQETFQGLLATPVLLTREDHAQHLTVPDETSEPEMAEVRALAHRITANAHTAPARINAVTAYLLTNYSYSLEFRPDGQGKDPLADFLLSSPKKGAHCEFFASAAVLLLRYAGVPARYVTGYYAHEGEGAGITVVRQRDAHAWCEAWIDGTGWITVEATPGDGRPDAIKEPIEVWRKTYEWFQDRMQALADLMANLTPEQINGGLGLFAIALALYGLWRFLLRRRRRQAPDDAQRERGYTPPFDASLAALARRFEAVWAKQGGPPFPVSRTYSEYLHTLKDDTEATTLTLPPFIEQAQEWADRYDRARFGSHFTEKDRDDLDEMLKEWEVPAQ